MQPSSHEHCFFLLWRHPFPQHTFSVILCKQEPCFAMTAKIVILLLKLEAVCPSHIKITCKHICLAALAKMCIIFLCEMVEMYKNPWDPTQKVRRSSRSNCLTNLQHTYFWCTLSSQGCPYACLVILLPHQTNSKHKLSPLLLSEVLLSLLTTKVDLQCCTSKKFGASNNVMGNNLELGESSHGGVLIGILNTKLATNVRA